MSPKYSFVIPIYNERENITHLVQRLSAVMNSIPERSEVFFVDDGSTDGSMQQLVAVHLKDVRFKLLSLSRNFGHQIAITAGIDHAEGEAVIIMDGDLQDPPEVALEMIAKWKEGYEVVYGVRSSREGDSFFKKVTAKFFYWMIAQLSDVKVPSEAGDYRLLDRKAVDAFKKLREKNRFVRGMVSWIGFKQTAVLFERDSRFAGKTKYPLRKMIRLAWDAVTSFSNLPLRLALRLGLAMAGLAFLGAVTAVCMKLFGGYVVRGWTSVILAVFFMSGIQLVVLGIIGEYVGQIVSEVKGRPLYLVNQVFPHQPTKSAYLEEAPLNFASSV